MYWGLWFLLWPRCNYYSTVVAKFTFDGLSCLCGSVIVSKFLSSPLRHLQRAPLLWSYSSTAVSWVVRPCLSRVESSALMAHPAHPTASVQCPADESLSHPMQAPSPGVCQKGATCTSLPIGLLWWGMLSGQHAKTTQLLQARVKLRNLETTSAPLLLQSVTDSLSDVLLLLPNYLKKKFEKSPNSQARKSGRKSELQMCWQNRWDKMGKTCIWRWSKHNLKMFPKLIFPHSFVLGCLCCLLCCPVIFSNNTSI